MANVVTTEPLTADISTTQSGGPSLTAVPSAETTWNDEEQTVNYGAVGPDGFMQERVEDPNEAMYWSLVYAYQTAGLFLNRMSAST